jgi:hypothetical protein
VRKPNKSFVVSPSFTFRTHVQFAQMPANPASGLDSSKANQMSPPSALLNSLKDVNGTTQRFTTPSQRFQCFEEVLRGITSAARPKEVAGKQTR